MTTGKGKATAAVQARRDPSTGLGNRSLSGRHSSQRLMTMGGLAAVVLGSQALAASSPQASAVRLLLPSEGVLAGLGDGLRRGYGLAMEQSRACGLRPPRCNSAGSRLAALHRRAWGTALAPSW